MRRIEDPRSTQTGRTSLRNCAKDVRTSDFPTQDTVFVAVAHVFAITAIEGLPIPYGTPNASHHVERILRTLRQEAPDPFTFLSVGPIQRVIMEPSVMGRSS